MPENQWSSVQNGGKLMQIGLTLQQCFNVLKWVGESDLLLGQVQAEKNCVKCCGEEECQSAGAVGGTDIIVHQPYVP